MAYIKIDANEMSKMILLSGNNTRINFVFGTGGVAIKSDDDYAFSLLEEIRDEKELNEYHRSFEL